MTFNVFPQALNYVSLGLSVIPLAPKQKTPAWESLKQAGYIENGRSIWKPATKKIADRKTLSIWYENTENNIGIVCGAVSGNLVCIDFDKVTYGGEWINNHEDIIKNTPMQLTNSGFHIFVKVDGILPQNGKFSLEKNSPSWVGDIRSEGGYVVAPPSRHPNGGEYMWVNPPEKGFVTVKSLAEIGVFIKDRKEVSNKKVKPRRKSLANIDRVKRALDLLPIDYADDYYLWSFVGMALKSSFGDAGFPLWNEFSKRSEKYNERAVRRQWQSFRYDGGLTVGSIFYWARGN